MGSSISSRLDRLERRLDPNENRCQIHVIIDNEDGTYTAGDLRGITEAELREYERKHMSADGRPTKRIRIGYDDREDEEYDYD